MQKCQLYRLSWRHTENPSQSILQGVSAVRTEDEPYSQSLRPQYLASTNSLSPPNSPPDGFHCFAPTCDKTFGQCKCNKNSSYPLKVQPQVYGHFSDVQQKICHFWQSAYHSPIEGREGYAPKRPTQPRTKVRIWYLQDVCNLLYHSRQYMRLPYRQQAVSEKCVCTLSHPSATLQDASARTVIYCLLSSSDLFLLFQSWLVSFTMVGQFYYAAYGDYNRLEKCSQGSITVYLNHSIPMPYGIYYKTVTVAKHLH